MEIYDNFKNSICLTVKMVFQVYLTLLDFALDNLIVQQLTANLSRLNFLQPVKI